MRRRKSLLTAILLASLPVCVAFGQDGSDETFFSEQVKPLLKQHCFECHRNDTDNLGGNLAMASRASMIVGGESGSVVDKNSIENSLLLRVLSYEDDMPQMPPEGKLSDEEIAVFKKRVELGLPWNQNDAIELE